MADSLPMARARSTTARSLATPPLALAVAGAALAFALPASADPPDSAPRPAGVMRVADVRPGMEVVAYTVFEGTKVEPFRGRVLGVVRNFYGPLRDIVLVDFYEEKVRHTGIVHGMSGSPAYIGDKVLGAVALVLSPLPRDAVAGITPLEYMLAEADGVPGGPAAGPETRTGAFGPPPSPAEGAPRTSGATTGASAPSRAAAAGSPAAFPAGAIMRPLAAPLTFAGGIRPAAFEHYRQAFAALGLDPVLGGGGSLAGAGAGGVQTGGQAARPALGPDDLRPGMPVSAVLADGDLSLDATGTITYRDGPRLFAFGHPFLQQGRLRLPMAPAEVVATIADQTYSYKVTNAGPPAGTITTDRTTTIAGEVGDSPPMFPMSVRVTREGADVATYSYRVSENPWVTPLVVQLLVANSLLYRWDYDEEATYHLRGTIRLKGHRPLALQEAYAIAPDPRSAAPFSLAADVGLAFAMLYMNPYAAPEVESIELRYDTSERGLIDRLDGLFVDPERVRAGENASIRVAVRGIRGARRVVALSVPIPGWAAGKRLALRVADSATLRSEAATTGSPLDRASSLEQLVDLLASRPRADRLYVQLLAFTPDSIVYHKRLPSLPSSVVEVMERGGGPYRRLPRAVVWETTLPAEGIAVGTQELTIEVRP